MLKPMLVSTAAVASPARIWGAAWDHCLGTGAPISRPKMKFLTRMLRIVEGSASAGINQGVAADNALAEANAVPACNSLLVLYRLRAPRQKL